MKVVRLILRCYPQAWRERYGDELLEISANEGMSLWLVLDLLRGAVDARLNAEMVSPRERRGPIVYVERELLSSRYRPMSGTTLKGVLSWLVWMFLGGYMITLVYYVLSVADLMSYPTREPGSGGELIWLQFLAAPVLGNILIRRLVHAGWRQARRIR